MTLPMIRFITLMLLGFMATSGSAASPDELYERVKTARTEQYAWQRWPSDTEERKRLREVERARANEAVVHAAGEFLAALAEDPRKWEVWSALLSAERRFTGPLAKADELAWQALTREVRTRILNTEGVPDAVWERVMTGEVFRARAAVEAEQKRVGAADVAPWRATLDRLSARTPESRMLGAFEGHYAEFLLAQDAGGGERFLQSLSGSRNPHVSAMAKGKLNAMAALKGPMELAFTAADGRSVDLARYRGKVVIIDFWATWCVPCLKELPNTKAAYEAYKVHGVEMIGISFDHAPKDPAKPVKSDRTKEQFLAEAASLGMDWPQYYDGLGWDCELGRRYNIVSIPRVWVLNREGVLQTQFAYGRQLWDLLAKLTGHTVEIPEQFRKPSSES